MERKNYYELTKQDIAAFKKADGITTIHTGKANYGEGKIMLYKDTNLYNPFKEIICNSFVEDYGQKYDDYKCIEGNSLLKEDTVFQTIVLSMKEGDELQLYWLKDNNNELIKEANLHKDEFKIKLVRRKTKKNGIIDTKHLVFNVVTIVSKNNSVRMIRRNF